MTRQWYQQEVDRCFEMAVQAHFAGDEAMKKHWNERTAYWRQKRDEHVADEEHRQNLLHTLSQVA